jgi:hypothetical protein
MCVNRTETRGWASLLCVFMRVCGVVVVATGGVGGLMQLPEIQSQ